MDAITPRLEGTACPACGCLIERNGAYILCACSYASSDAWQASFCSCGGVGANQHLTVCAIVRAQKGV